MSAVRRRSFLGNGRRISALRLADSINEKLYDQFQDSVLQMDDVPVLVEDYINDLKEMVLP